MKKLLLALLTAVMCFAFVGCGPSKEDVLTTILEGIKAGDFASFEEHMINNSKTAEIFESMTYGEELTDSWNLIQENVFSKMTYTIESAGDGDYNVSITSPDIGTALKNAMNAAIEADAQNGTSTVLDVPTWFAAAAANPGEPVTTDVTVTVQKSDDDGSLYVSSVDFLKAATGGAYEYSGITTANIFGEYMDMDVTYLLVALYDDTIAMVTHTSFDYASNEASYIDEILKEYQADLTLPENQNEGITLNYTAADGVFRESTGISLLTADPVVLLNKGYTTSSKGDISLSESIDELSFFGSITNQASYRPATPEGDADTEE